MGWGFGLNSQGRAVGYDVPAVCDEPLCETVIHRGLAFVCGGSHDGGLDGCGEYFCYAHLYHENGSDGKLEQFCKRCQTPLTIIQDAKDALEEIQLMREEQT